MTNQVGRAFALHDREKIFDDTFEGVFTSWPGRRAISQQVRRKRSERTGENLLHGTPYTATGEEAVQQENAGFSFTISD